nr:HRDC domain-containing protein [Tessaracoccus sp. OS52]
MRPVVSTGAQLEECLAALSAAEGPVAFDAERAHGHRYWPKAYLFQIRREGAGTWLIDPVEFETDGVAQLSSLVDVCGDATWVVHAASQDLTSMREAGVVPPRLFDTELGARLLGEPGVSLGALLESKLGISLRKAHSAQNWSTRPLPTDWLIYAALDVDYLLELAEVIHSELAAAGRLEWAEQEFAATLEHFRMPAAPRQDPWRRLSGVTSLRSPRQLAVARELWQERDRIARERDRPPGRILHDSAIIELAARAKAEAPLPGAADVSSIPGFRHRGSQRYRTNWLQALERVTQLKPGQYPARRPPATGIPHPKNWDRTHPEAAELWPRVRAAVDELACELMLQPSLIAPPAILQEVVYHHVQEPDFGDSLRRRGARAWQVEFLEPLLLEVSGRV